MTRQAKYQPSVKGQTFLASIEIGSYDCQIINGLNKIPQISA